MPLRCLRPRSGVVRRLATSTTVVVAAVAASGGLLAACAAPSEHPTAASVTVPTDVALTVPPPTASSPPGARKAARAGISPGITLLGEDDATLARDLDGIARTGAAWLRVDFDWSYVQRWGPRAWDWSRIDRVVAAARDRGLDVLAVLSYTPDWARPPGTPSKHPPLDPGDFARFAHEAVRRYAPLGVHTYEVWNEPNVSSFWDPLPDPEGYAALLAAAATAIRAADPDAVVVTGGLAPASDRSDGSEIHDTTFLERVYAAGAGDDFDAVGLHPYSFPRLPMYPADYNTFQTSPALYQVMVEHGDASKRIWATETGAPTGTGPGAVTGPRQAEILRRAYRQWAAWSFTGPLLWYSWRDTSTDPTVRGDHFGLVALDGSPKPALRAFDDVVAALPTSPADGRYEATSAASPASARGR